MTDLSLCSTDDLLEEVIKRFDHVIFSGIQVAYASTKQNVVRRKFKGDYTICSGLCSQLDFYVNLTNHTTSAPYSEDN